MSSKTSVEIKGGMYTFMSLKLYTSDTDIIDEQLADKVQQAPAFFKDTPIVLDLKELEKLTNGELDGSPLIECIKRHKLVPIVATIVDKESDLARSMSIPLIEASSRGDNVKSDTENTDEAKPATAEEQVQDKETVTRDSTDNVDSDIEFAASAEVEYVVKAPTLLTRPVRSGQQIYARDTDLIIMGSVAPGAEVIADNNIHIYGPLRGRALCGVSGNASTRIFCSSLEAELVSVAGNYRMLETIPEELRGKPAQIWLDKDRLSIESL